MNDASSNAAKVVLNTEIRSLQSLSRSVHKELSRAVDLLGRTRGKIVVSGVGKSGYIGMKIAATLTSLGMPAVFLHPAEAMHGDLGIVGQKDSLIALSYSGETKEILRLVSHVKKARIPIVGITGSKRSALAKSSNVAIVFSIENEGSPYNLAPMTSTTTSLVIGDMLASALSALRGFTKETFANFHPGGSLGLQLTPVKDVMSKKRKVPLVKEAARLQEVVRRIGAHGFGTTGVVNERGTLIGIITDGDIRRHILSPGFSNTVTAAQLMSRAPKTIQSEASLQEAMREMELHKVTSLFVLSATHKPIGILHLHQIVESNLL